MLIIIIPIVIVFVPVGLIVWNDPDLAEVIWMQLKEVWLGNE
jgi:hypothetical protein